MVVDLSHRIRAITINDMAGVKLIANNYNVQAVVIVTNARINFNFSDAFPNIWTCWVPVDTNVIESDARFALSFNYFIEYSGWKTSYLEIANHSVYEDENDFYSQFLY
ncbi:hypothetical protein A936_08883 [Enterobacter sp. Ag1]|nr:hypothetical protein A936_08883 [Enterobacter sp. Ag1]